MSKLTHEEAFIRVSKMGLKLLDQFTNVATKVRIQCFCEKQTIFLAKLNNIFNGNVKSCGCLRMTINNKKLNNFIGKRFSELLIIGIMPPIKNQRRRFICKCNCYNFCTISIRQLLKNKSIANNCGCLNIAKLIETSKKFSGKKHYRYNPTLTVEDRIKLRPSAIKTWRKEIYQRDNYICNICSIKKRQLNAHHLDGWSNCKEKRFDLDNGITLCKECHDNFHNKYGRGNNTKSQYIEFKENYVKSKE